MELAILLYMHFCADFLENKTPALLHKEAEREIKAPCSFHSVKKFKFIRKSWIHLLISKNQTIY